MARTLTPVDCYTLINAIAKEATGQEALLQAQDTSSFVSVGETILNTGYENTLNAISIVIGRTFMAVRPYEAKLRILNTLNSGLYTNRMRKISYYSRDAQASGAFNTNLYTNHAMGYDNGSNGGSSLPTMWEQNQPVPLEMNFGGRSVWDDSTTIYEVQLQEAFRDESSFATFMNGIMTEKGNDLETQKEAFNRATLLNFIGGIYDMDQLVSTGSAIDLAAGFNAKYGTSYTRAQLLYDHRQEFLEYFVSTVKYISDTLTNRSKKFHWSPSKTIGGTSYTLLRHTPKSRQKMILLSKAIYDAEATVLPQIFNPQYLNIENYEKVDFWQNENLPEQVSITPAIPDTSDPTQQIAGDPVVFDYLVGILFDEDAIMVDYQLDAANSTPVEARKRYRNIWWHYARNAINDFTENAVLFYIGQGAPAPEPEPGE